MIGALSHRTIARELEKLVGLRAWGPGLAAGMLTVAFGDKHTETSHGKTRQLGDYALHIQCDWRLALIDSIVVGFGDYLADESEALIHGRLKRAFAAEPRVTGVSGIRGGGFLLALETDLAVEAFPCLTSVHPETEFWRMFKPSSPQPHFVVTSSGVAHGG